MHWDIQGSEFSVCGGEGFPEYYKLEYLRRHRSPASDSLLGLFGDVTGKSTCGQKEETKAALRILMRVEMFDSSDVRFPSQDEKWKVKSLNMLSSRPCTEISKVPMCHDVRCGLCHRL